MTDLKKQMEEVNEYLKKTDEMTVPELRDLETLYKKVYFPSENFRNFAIWNAVYVAGTALYGWKLKTTATWLFPRKYYSFGELFKYGTINAVAMTTIYLLGSCISTGIWNPIERIRNLTHIQGKILDKLIVQNDFAQQYLLLDMMKYFGLSDQLMKNAMEELAESKKKDITESSEYLNEKPKSL